MSDEDHSEDRVTVWASEDLTERVDDRVDWKHSSRSEWVRQAIQMRLLVENELERRGVDVPDDRTEREDLVADLLRAGIDQEE